MVSLRRSAAAARTERARPLPTPVSHFAAFRQALPFALTHAQQTALDEIVADLAARTPMNRLLQGDVGSGKTVVAALAAVPLGVIPAPLSRLTWLGADTSSRVATSASGT